MAGVKPSVNLFASLDRNDPGDLDTDKSTATPAASLTQELFGHAYPSARDYVIRQNQLERQAWAEKRAADRAKTAGGGGAKQQSGMSGGRNNGAPRRQQPSLAAKKVPAGQDKATPATVQAPPPSLYDINQFPSLK